MCVVVVKYWKKQKIYALNHWASKYYTKFSGILNKKNVRNRVTLVHLLSVIFIFLKAKLN